MSDPMKRSDPITEEALERMGCRKCITSEEFQASQDLTFLKTDYAFLVGDSFGVFAFWHNQTVGDLCELCQRFGFNPKEVPE